MLLTTPYAAPQLEAVLAALRQRPLSPDIDVNIERGASAGSFFTIPPQTQVEIAARKKIITDEHSGRILVDSSLADEERQKMEALFASI